MRYTGTTMQMGGSFLLESHSIDPSQRTDLGNTQPTTGRIAPRLSPFPNPVSIFQCRLSTVSNKHTQSILEGQFAQTVRKKEK